MQGFEILRVLGVAYLKNEPMLVLPVAMRDMLRGLMGTMIPPTTVICDTFGDRCSTGVEGRGPLTT